MNLGTERVVPMKEKRAVFQKVARVFSKVKNILFPQDFLRRKRVVPKNDFKILLDIVHSYCLARSHKEVKKSRTLKNKQRKHNLEFDW